MQRAILFPFKYCLKIWAVVKQALKREKFFLALNDRFKEGEKLEGSVPSSTLLLSPFM